MPPNGPKPPAAVGVAAPLQDITAPPPAVSASPAAEGPSASTYSGSTATYPVPAYGSTTTELSWLRFLGVPLSMRSWLSLTIIHVEKVLEYLVNLRAENLIPTVQEALRRISKHLELIVHNFQSPFLDNGSLLHLGLERLQNLLFHATGPVWVLRLNVNMTDANKVDSSERLGTAFKYAVLEWLKEAFGRHHVSLDPGGTSFIVTGVQRHEISQSLGHFEREIRYILDRKDMQERFGFDSGLLDEFVPKATATVAQINTNSLNVMETLSSGDRALIFGLQEKIIELIELSLKHLAVLTTVVEKDPASIGLAGGLAVYDVGNLPIFPWHQGNSNFLKEALETGRGHVPIVVYLSPVAGYDSDQTATTLHPRPGHDLGKLDRPPRQEDPGGALQVLQAVLVAASRATSPDEKAQAIKAIEEAVQSFKNILLRLAGIARHDPRNPLFEKFEQLTRLHDNRELNDFYFTEQLALFPEREIHLVLVELDYFRAFSIKYGTDKTDSRFWGVFDHFFYVAGDMRMRAPVLAKVSGDLVAVAVPVVNREGNPVNISEYVSRVKEEVDNAYYGLPFQAWGKEEIPNGVGIAVKRSPLWVTADGGVIAADEKPVGTEAFMKTVSFTSVATTIAKPTDVESATGLLQIITRAADIIEKLKEDPHKGKFMVVPPGALAEGEGSTSFLYGGIHTPSPGRQEMARARIGDGIDGIYDPYGVMGDPRFREFDALVRQQLGAWGDWANLPAETQNVVISHLAGNELPPIITDAMIHSALLAAGYTAQLATSPPPVVYLPLTFGLPVVR